MKLRALFLFCIAVLFLPAVAVGETRAPSAPRPQCNITANPGAVVIGNTVTLSWSSQNATGGVITSLGTVGPSGRQGVIPTARSHTYVGAFTGPGGSVNCSVEVGILQFTGGGSGGGEVDRGGVAGSGVAPLTPSGGAGGSAARPTGLLPCTGINCQACHLAGLAQNIINWLVGISIPLAAAMFAYAGILYFSSSIAGRLDDAHKIFKNVGIGFLIVICSWLVIQTILKTVLAPKFYQSWNSIACVDDSKRPINKSIQDMLGLIGGRLNTRVDATLPANYGGNLNGVPYDLDSGCAYGSRWNASLGGCQNDDGDLLPPIGFGPSNPYREPSSYTQCYGEDMFQDGHCLGAEGYYPPYAQSDASSGPEGSCRPGYRYAEDAEYAWCQGPGGAEDILDFQSTPRGGPVLQCSLDAEGCGDIVGATSRYHGTDTSAGPDRGNLACAWSVNNILRDAGIAPIDGNSVQSMRDELDAGRGERVNLADAREGDIIVWQGIGANGRRVSHVGFCEDDGCAVTSSNNSATARYGINSYTTTLNGVTGVVYRVNR